jgi:hypothetical protein
MEQVDAEYAVFHRKRLAEESAAAEREMDERLKRLPKPPGSSTTE